jgi:SAM-dependent methyltransferase
MPPFVAGALVFVTSAAILVLEILAGRLLAPYVGDTLETYTAIIGTVLTGIAVGTWAGGRLADRRDPRRLIGPLLVVGGLLAVSAVPIVRALGDVGGSELERGMMLCLLAFFPMAAVLSAVSPAVVKLQLHDLGRTGQVVGRYSALSTAGAVIGTFLAGFVLIEAARTSVLVVVTGGLVIAIGVAMWLWLDRLRLRSGAAVAVLALGTLSLGATVGNGCAHETTYHCARIETDPANPAGRALWLDTLRHSYVDLDDPAHLEFAYTRGLAAAIDATQPEGEALDTVHLGGAGYTMPRWLDATRAGSTSIVLEIDQGLVDLVAVELDPPSGPGFEVRVGDARLLVADLPDDSADVVVGDAFGGVAVPWHLTTKEFVAQVHRVLRPSGVYVANIIDGNDLRFLRAELATLRAVFADVAVVGPAATFAGAQRSNLVVLASDEPISLTRLDLAVGAVGLDQQVLTGADVDALIDDAPVLTDDYAPVDQYLLDATNSPRR